ncbi:MAG: cation transporter [Thermoguttaceae bacterium]|nr:cation transporter [Thermoguttaceae bacterium]MBR4104716.1 cation transporter [Thermoguttaceae bacterium]
MKMLSRAEADEIRLAAISRVTIIGSLINVALTALKTGVGVFSGSTALVADGLHSLSDLATDAIVLVGSRLWSRPADASHPNGHAKIESLATLFVALALALVSVELLRSSIAKIGATLDGGGAPLQRRALFFALGAALLSVVAKEALYRATVSVGRRTRSTAVVANAWHHRSDALSSIPTALAIAGVLAFGPRFAFLDPVGAIVVAFMILKTAFEIARPTVATLCDASADAQIVDAVRKIALENAAIQFPHKIRTRPLGGALYAAHLHVLVDPETTVRDAHRLSHELAAEIRARVPAIVETTIHVEPFDERRAADSTTPDNR